MVRFISEILTTVLDTKECHCLLMLNIILWDLLPVLADILGHRSLTNGMIFTITFHAYFSFRKS